MSKSQIVMIEYERKQGNWTHEHIFGLTVLLFGTLLTILGLGQKMPIFLESEIPNFVHHFEN